MEFRILGPFEVVDGERSIPLGGPRQRALLALLLVARGKPVATDALVDALWSGAPPTSARKGVQAYVSELRHLLGDDRIETVGRGYALRSEPAELDAARFERAVGAAADGTAVEAGARLRDALRLVRGEPLEGFRCEDWAREEAERLDELVLGAVEARVDADLALGEHRALIPELSGLVTRHPHREHLLEQLMLALYRSDRQVEALGAFRTGAARMRTDFGLEPSRHLQELEQAILNQEPALDAPGGRSKPAGGRGRWVRVALAGVVVAALFVTTAWRLASKGGDSFSSLAPGLVLIDMQEHRVVARWPYSGYRYPWVTTGNGHFWLASMTSAFDEIDPRTGHIVRSTLPPSGTGTNLALPRGQSIWFTGNYGLARYDLSGGRGQETARYRIVRGRHRFGLEGVALGAGSIWVASHEENEVVRVDPRDGAVEARIEVPLPVWLSFGDGGLWVSSDTAGIERIDPATNTVAAVSPLPEPIDEVVVGGGFAWATNNPKGTVYKVDASGRIVDTYETGDGAHEPSYSQGTLWVSNESAGTLTSIDGATGEQTSYRFGHPLGTEAALGRYVMVAITEGLTVEDQLAKLHGRIAKLVIPSYQLDPPDPPLLSSPFAFEVERATCATLLRYSATTGRPVPELAARPPTVSPDGLTYTFAIRSGLRFAPPSGARVTAAAIAYSIRRALSPKLGTPRPAAAYLGDLRRIDVRGNNVAFTLRAPSRDFLERLSLPYFCTVPPGTPIVAGGVQPTAPPSAGPYYMDSRGNGAWTVLKRNPYYRGPRPARLDAIVLREGLDPERAVELVRDGDWDGLALADAFVLPPPSSAAGLEHRVAPEARLDYLALNSRRGPFRDGGLRRRVSAALDRAALATAASVEPTAGLLPPGVRGGSVEPAGTRGRVPSRMPPIHVTLAVDRDHENVAGVVSSALRPLGVAVTPVVVEDPAAVIARPGGRIDMAVLETDLPYPDPASFLARLLGHDVPTSWLPATTRSAVARLGSLSGRRRDRAAIALSGHLERADVPVVAYGTPTIGVLIGPRLGCRTADDFDSELDLTTLCLSGG